MSERASFISELKRRNVIRVAGLYLVGAWLLVQVAATGEPAAMTSGLVCASPTIVSVPRSP